MMSFSLGEPPPEISQTIGENLSEVIDLTPGLIPSAYDKYTLRVLEYVNPVLAYRHPRYEVHLGPITKEEHDRREKQRADYAEGERIYNESRRQWEALSYYPDNECPASCCN